MAVNIAKTVIIRHFELPDADIKQHLGKKKKKQHLGNGLAAQPLPKATATSLLYLIKSIHKNRGDRQYGQRHRDAIRGILTLLNKHPGFFSNNAKATKLKHNKRD